MHRPPYHRSGGPEARKPWSSTGRRSALLVSLLPLLVSVGCAAGGIHYKAPKLPAQYAAMPVESAQTLDLSKLAGPATPAERIAEGDVLEVTIAGGLGRDATTTLPLRVSDQGYVIIPEIGQIPLAGLELVDAESAIHSACVSSGQFLRPSVAVTMKSQRENKITVIGAVEEPGVKSLRRGSSYLMDAFVAAGGLAEDADVMVEITQPGAPGMMAGPSGTSGVQPVSANMEMMPPRAEELNLVDAVSDPGGGKYLADGAVVMVKKREPRPLHIMGLVNNPDVYDYPINRDLDVLGAIAMAGGLSVPVADKVYVIRSREDVEEPIVIEVSLRRAKRRRAENVRLEPGDVVSVEETPATVAMHALEIIRFSIGSSVPLF